MFDHLLCDADLPDGYDRCDDFQTKSFECLLDTYRITAGGRLERKRSYWAVGDADVVLYWEPLADFHGDVVFYDYDRRGLLPLAPHEPARWREYVARFAEGRLAGIRVVHDLALADGEDG